MKDKFSRINATDLISGDRFTSLGDMGLVFVVTGMASEVVPTVGDDKEWFRIWCTEEDTGRRGWWTYSTDTRVLKLVKAIPPTRWVKDGYLVLRQEPDDDVLFNWEDLRDELNDYQASMVHKMIGSLISRHNEELPDER